MKAQDAIKLLDSVKMLVEHSSEVPADMQNSIGQIIGTYRDEIRYAYSIDTKENYSAPEFDFEVERALLKVIIHTIEAARK